MLERGQASATRDANLSLVITLPGFAARYLLQAFEKLLLKKRLEDTHIQGLEHMCCVGRQAHKINVFGLC